MHVKEIYVIFIHLFDSGILLNRNDPDLVQAFLKKWWVESDFKEQNLSFSLRLKVSRCHYNSIYNVLIG
jgi:hypothetical protein